MKIFSLLATLILASYFLFLTIMESKRPDVNVSAVVDAELKINSSTVEFKKFIRLGYLYTIALALEEYKRKNFTYPVSQNEGKSWNLKTSSAGEISNWIPGINVIIFEDKLVSSSRTVEQYAYISDGINYRLIAINPEDCSLLEKAHPELISYHNELCSYGFWTYHPN